MTPSPMMAAEMTEQPSRLAALLSRADEIAARYATYCPIRWQALSGSPAGRPTTPAGRRAASGRTIAVTNESEARLPRPRT